MLISHHQVKAARSLLDWTQEDLANHAGLEVSQVRRFERGESKTLDILEAIQTAFSNHSIEFIAGGVRKRQAQIRVLQGQQGFWDFYDDVYETMRELGGHILISGVDGEEFHRWHGERGPAHIERMKQLGNFEQKIIVKEDGSHVPPTFSTTEYRTLPPARFPDAPFYFYGRKLAILSFQQDNVSIFMIEEPKVATAYEKIFFSLWETAKRTTA